MRRIAARIRAHATYANVMSTIAMFAAVTTGGAYAATKLAPNSVRTAHIKNGQVTVADLHPTVRNRLQRAGAPAGGQLLPVGEWTRTDTLAVGNGTTDLSKQVGTTGRVEFRIVGTGTRGDVSISFKNAAGRGVAGLGVFSPTTDGTFDASQLTYVGTNDLDADPTDSVFTTTAANAQTVVATHSAATGGLRTMTLQVRRVA